jgi:hypothetical protein
MQEVYIFLTKTTHKLSIECGETNRVVNCKKCGIISIR